MCSLYHVYLGCSNLDKRRMGDLMYNEQVANNCQEIINASSELQQMVAEMMEAENKRNRVGGFFAS